VLCPSLLPHGGFADARSYRYIVIGMGIKADAASLRKVVEEALAATPPPSRVLPLLRRLAQHAALGSEEYAFAHGHLAELLLEQSPWRASLHARRVLQVNASEHRAWATLALAQTLLRHFRYARHAYLRALAICPDNPWYAHNLGHVLDAALGQPLLALPFLAKAYAQCGQHPDVIASYAHALAKAGRVPEAKEVLRALPPRKRSQEHREMLAWLRDDGPHVARPVAMATTAREPWVSAKRRYGERTLLAVLGTGMRHLPIPAPERDTVRALARRSLELARLAGDRKGPPPEVLAAAVALYMLRNLSVPLSAAEVAGPFRAPVDQVELTCRWLQRRIDRPS
jgi:tetratricopeptide (TPR) repeat protein